MEQRDETPPGKPHGGGVTAVTVAGAVRQNLERAVEERRRQAVAISQLVGGLNARIREISDELARSQEENRALRAEMARRDDEYESLLANHRRLFEGFTTVVRAVEDADGIQVSINQRIEAALLSSDIGLSLGSPADITPARVGTLIEEAIHTPALQTSHR